jgi:hypothetical protein
MKRPLGSKDADKSSQFKFLQLLKNAGEPIFSATS